MDFPPAVVDRVIARQGRLHPYDHFDARSTAFVVVDLQNYYTQPGYLGECAAARQTFGAVNRLAGALRVLLSGMISARNCRFPCVAYLRGAPAMPMTWNGMKMTFTPMKVSMKCILPMPSFIIRPNIFGNQK